MITLRLVWQPWWQIKHEWTTKHGMMQMDAVVHELRSFGLPVMAIRPSRFLIMILLQCALSVTRTSIRMNYIDIGKCCMPSHHTYPSLATVSMHFLHLNLSCTSWNVDQPRTIKAPIPFDHTHLIDLLILRLERPTYLFIMHDLCSLFSTPKTSSQDTKLG